MLPSEIQQCHSKYKLAKSGVPQGSVLGPSLYLICTADLSTTDNTTITTFADDIALLAIDSDPISITKTPTTSKRFKRMVL
jgi:hypothetical protein